MSGNQRYFCSYCGASIAPEDAFCNNCGQSTSETQSEQPTYAPPQTETLGSTSYAPQQYSQPGYVAGGYAKPVQQKASTGLIILSFIIPLVGLILAIVNGSKGQSQAAKSYGIAAAVGFAITLALNFIPWFGF